MTMSDMTAVIAPKSDQINADDLIGGDMVITITAVKIRPGEDQPVSMQFEGSAKVYRPCKSMSRVIVAIWGADTSAYPGRSLKLYRDPDVQWGGMKVGGIRIREMSHMEGNRPVTLALTEKRGSRKPAVIRPLVEQAKPEPAGMTQDDARRLASVVANRGTDAFRAWFNSDEGKSCRAAGGLDIDALKAACARADAAIAADPFGLPPVQATDDEINAQIAAEIRARDAALEGDN